MFLKNLKIKNVRSIVDMELSFELPNGGVRPWTFILGENGAGKSTVLRCAALLTAGSDALPDLIGEPSIWIRNGCKSCCISGELMTSKGEIRPLTIVMKRGQTIRDIYRENAETLDLLDSAIAHSARNYFTIGYGTSRRLGSSTSQKSRHESFSHSRSRSVATLFSSAAELMPLEEWAIDLHYRKESKGLSMVRSALQGMIPNVKFKGINRDKRTLEFNTPDGVIPLSQLSDGYQNVIAWCGDLLYNITEIFDDYNNPFNARGLLLIDEVDLHLHPIWQRTLVEFLSRKLKNFQVIATTHSPLTAHQAGEGELFFLKRGDKKQGSILHPYAGAPDRLLVHQLLMSPAFGLDTANSRQVEEEREELKTLKRKKRKSKRDREKVEKLTASLANTPDWTKSSATDKKIASLLTKIEKEVSSK